MNINEAKEFYFSYDGNAFWMEREEPEKYKGYRNLSIAAAIQKQWDEELVCEKLRNLWSKPDRVWRIHESIIRILLRNPDDYEDLGSKLLDEMEKMPTLDKQSRTLIIENMAGQNADLDNGGVYYFCNYTNLGKRMNEITGKIMDFSYDQETDTIDSVKLQDRLERAKDRYRESYQKWSQNGEKYN